MGQRVGESSAARALAELLEEGGVRAKRIKASGIHRTRLWAYATFRAKPNAETASMLHRLSGGYVAAHEWESDLDEQAVAS